MAWIFEILSLSNARCSQIQEKEREKRLQRVPKRKRVFIASKLLSNDRGTWSRSFRSSLRLETATFRQDLQNVSILICASSNFQMLLSVSCLNSYGNCF